MSVFANNEWSSTMAFMTSQAMSNSTIISQMVSCMSMGSDRMRAPCCASCRFVIHPICCVVSFSFAVSCQKRSSSKCSFALFISMRTEDVWEGGAKGEDWGDILLSIDIATRNFSVFFGSTFLRFLALGGEGSEVTGHILGCVDDILAVGKVQHHDLHIRKTTPGFISTKREVAT